MTTQAQIEAIIAKGRAEMARDWDAGVAAAKERHAAKQAAIAAQWEAGRAARQRADMEAAASAFVRGALAGLSSPMDMTGWENGRRFADSYDRQSAWNAEYSRREREMQMAALDRCLASIAARRDILDLVEAA